jgi:hypothetical protein
MKISYLETIFTTTTTAKSFLVQEIVWNVGTWVEGFLNNGPRGLSGLR